jgi:hypothetical protein
MLKIISFKAQTTELWAKLLKLVGKNMGKDIKNHANAK